MCDIFGDSGGQSTSGNVWQTIGQERPKTATGWLELGERGLTPAQAPFDENQANYDQAAKRLPQVGRFPALNPANAPAPFDANQANYDQAVKALPQIGRFPLGQSRGPSRV
ncbi:MAG: hypothetical protein GEV06_16840 [Luteitalea sp.]|nr:hypothetical protein [Luteitalea sp.]